MSWKGDTASLAAKRRKHGAHERYVHGIFRPEIFNAQPTVRAGGRKVSAVPRAAAAAAVGDGDLDPYTSIEQHLEPFPSLVISDVLHPEFYEALRQELAALEYTRKSNDLYSFAQSKDLASEDYQDLGRVQTLLKALYSPIFTGLIGRLTRQVLGQAHPALYHFDPAHTGEDHFHIPVTSLRACVRPDLSAFKYTQGDHLLPHDDHIKSAIAQSSRRVAFILYLLPLNENWPSSNGGSLDLFPVSHSGLPASEPSFRIMPKANTLALFPLSATSFHQVAEITCGPAQTRMSIGGWIHGPSGEMQDDVSLYTKFWHTDPSRSFQQAYKDFCDPFTQSDLEELSQYINAQYLVPETLKSVADELGESSSIQLPDFLRPQVYWALLAELHGADVKWLHPQQLSPLRGRWMTLADDVHHSLDTVRTLLRSGAFGKWLRHATRLMPILSKVDMRRYDGGSYELLSDLHSGGFEGVETIMSLDGNPFSVLTQEHDSWQVSYGGQLHYVGASEEDASADPVHDEEPLLTLSPSGNSLTIVIRDRSTMRFVKKVSRAFLPRDHLGRLDLYGQYLVHGGIDGGADDDFGGTSSHDSAATDDQEQEDDDVSGEHDEPEGPE